MSLINQMLTDLEKRRSRDQHAAGGLLRDVRVSGRPRPGGVRRLPVLMLLLGSALVLTVAAGERILAERSSAPGRSAEAPALRVAVPVAADEVPVAPLPVPAPAVSPLSETGAEALIVAASPAGLTSQGESPQEVAGRDEAPAGSTLLESAADGGRHEAPPLAAPSAKLRAGAARVPIPPPAGGGAVAAPPAPVEPVAGAMARVMRTPTPEEAAETALRAGRGALTGGRLLQAEAHLRHALELAPEHRRGREELGRFLALQGRTAEAILLLQEGLRLAPAHLPFVKDLARLQAERGEWNSAGELLQRAEAPTLGADPEFHALAAAVHQRLGDFAAAADLYRQLVAHSPGNATWWIGLGIALEGAGRGSDAGEAYRRGLTAGGAGAELAKYARERLMNQEIGR